MTVQDSTYARHEWFRHNAGVFITRASLDASPVAYEARTAHCEVVIATSAAFSGTFTIYAVPTSADVNSSALGVWVDGVFSQTVTFDVGSLLSKQQPAVVSVSPGAHTIRIQEGDRDTGVAITRIVIDGGLVVPAPAVVRSYTTFGDSVSMGVTSVPRSVGWAESMKGGGSRFDNVVNLGKSGYSLNTAVLDGITQYINQMLPAASNYVGSTENVVAVCMSLNDWFPSGNAVSAATHQTNLGNLVTALKARADLLGTPGFKLMLHSLTYVPVASRVANGFGSTPADFNTAIQAVATANPTFCTFVNLFSGAGMVDGDMSDALHPLTAGHAKIYAAVVAAT